MTEERSTLTIDDCDAYMLRTCNADRTSHGGFLWPAPGGYVEAPDWSPEPVCGGGLHGLLWGEGGHRYLDWSEAAIWQVVGIVEEEAVTVDGDKIKVPRGVVAFEGDRFAATLEIIRLGARGAVVGAFVAAGDEGTATTGYKGTATAGDRGTATAGTWGTATTGYKGTATAGDRGTATAGDRGAATAGYEGTATTGYKGTATAGDRGTATAGDRGAATAGDRGTIHVRWWDCEAERYRTAVGYVGEDGIRPGVAYRVEGRGKLVEVTK